MSADIIHFADRTTVPPPAEAEIPNPNWRGVDRVREDISRHMEARTAYAKAVAWEAAAESQGLPPSQIEEARQRTAVAYSELQERSRLLVICGARDPRGLVDLLLYLERNWSSIPECLRQHSVAFTLLRSMRLSLRAIAKYGKYDGSREDK